MNKIAIVKKILRNRYQTLPQKDVASAFAPANIALIKYWGKRDSELNLPNNSSLSIGLNQCGTYTTITSNTERKDSIILNNQRLRPADPFAKRLSQFLDLFRPHRHFFFTVETKNHLPTKAGLASSASGFAALTMALNQLFDWRLDLQTLSILARLGSGSASRSLFNGFVYWQRGKQKDGMDSFSEPLPYRWKELRVGILTLSTRQKILSSREAMQRTVLTSPFYKVFVQQSSKDIGALEQAIANKNFSKFGTIVESNSLAMHATALAADPSICYLLPKTVSAIRKIWDARQEELAIYFTQDAGPNLVLLFLEPDTQRIRTLFPAAGIIDPFPDN